MKKNKVKFSELTQTEKNILLRQLESTNNSLDFLNLIIDKFDLESNQPGTITKGMLSRSMICTVLPLLNPTVNEKGI